MKRTIAVYLRARRIRRLRHEREAREWAEDRAAHDRYLDRVDAYWWEHEWPRRIFGPEVP